jgi:hypothetical protein
MAGKAGLKAGAIGAAIMLVPGLINHLLPIAENAALMYTLCGISLAIYASTGVLAGLFLARPRTPGKGAGAGAIAGLISGIIYGGLGFVMIATGFSSLLASAQVQQTIEQGLSPMVFAVIGITCNPILGSALAAIGGAVFAAVKPD